MSDGDPLAAGRAALAAGRWQAAREAFEAALAGGDSAPGCAGLGTALWWLGDNAGSVARHSQAYALFRRIGDDAGAVRSAVWLAITYKSDFANPAAANGWLGRAERLLGPDGAGGALAAWVSIARAYRMPDLDEAESLTAAAVDTARAAGDVDAELCGLAQLGLIRVGKGDTDDGFALIDEAMAGVLSGEPSDLETVVYACCDMLRACELVNDLERAAQWCRVADGFVEAYGSPFLYAECRISYGSVLAAHGRWDEAGRELAVAARTARGASPGLHARALTRLAGLRVRQGRLEEAERLLSESDEGVEAEAERGLWVAALQLARGEPAAAGRTLQTRLDRMAAHRVHHAAALELMVDAALAAGEGGAAAGAAVRLGELADVSGDARLAAASDGAVGRVMAAQGRTGEGVVRLERAVAAWADLDAPYEASAARLWMAEALAGNRPERAVEEARRAMAGFTSLGASRHADRAGALLRSLGARPAPGVRSVGALTAREREVLGLVAAGLSNPEIAARIHISRKTAAHHVSRILAKLDLRNRAEAAAFAAAAGEPDAE